MLLVALTSVVAVTTQLRCVDAAREAARAAGRGEVAADVTAVARREAPASARIIVGPTSQKTVSVTVSSRVRSLGIPLPGIVVRATAVAEREGAPAVGP